MMDTRKTAIQRLNEILRLPQVYLDSLDDQGWSELLDKMYFAVFGKRDRLESLRRSQENGWDGDTFHYAMTREMVRAAQEGLRGQLFNLRHGRADREPMMEFALAAHTVYIAWDRDRFAHSYLLRDAPTLLYSTFVRLIEHSGIRPTDFRVCADPACQAVYIPLRKPHKGEPPYCDRRHAKKRASKRYRDRNQELLRVKEQSRNDRRYRKRVEQMFPESKVAIKTRLPRR